MKEAIAVKDKPSPFNHVNHMVVKITIPSVHDKFAAKSKHDWLIVINKKGTII